MTVTLRSSASSDDAWLDSWLPAVAASVGYDAASPRYSREKASRSGGAERRIIERAGQRVGVVIYREHAPARASATIELIATPPECARGGSGMRAAAVIEEQLRARGIETIYAPASAVHGISMYFWIRLGYRPLLRDEWPCERDGVAWLMRCVEE